MARLPNGYWKDFAVLETELNLIIEELGHFPSTNELIEMDKHSIKHAMQIHHGGIKVVRKRMGYDQLFKSAGYWENFSNLENELNPIIEELGHFPSTQELRDLDGNRIINAFKHHGGSNTVRERMDNSDLLMRSVGYWENFSNLENELNPIIEELGHFPAASELRNIGKSLMISAMQRHHGGMNSVRERMGYIPMKEEELNELENLVRGYLESD